MTLSIASARKFGVEIECTGITYSRALNVLEDAGIPVNRGQSGWYNHTDLENEWKVTTDSSISGTGCELVSPILSGVEGLEQVRKVADAINTAGATANRSCGLHVHVDARDLSGADIANVGHRYAKFEGKIDACMPNSRRASRNMYCSSVVGIKDNMKTLRDSNADRDTVLGNHRSRAKLNFGAFSRHGSIEIRHHSGTVQSTKILPWIQFCVNFVEKSRVTVARRSNTTSRSGRDSKTLVAYHKIVTLISEAGYMGANPEFVAFEIGVKLSSCRVYVSKLRKEYGFDIKTRGGRWIMRRNGALPGLQSEAAAEETPVVSFNDAADTSPFKGLPRSVQSYFTERAADLAA